MISWGPNKKRFTPSKTISDNSPDYSLSKGLEFSKDKAPLMPYKKPNPKGASYDTESFPWAPYDPEIARKAMAARRANRKAVNDGRALPSPRADKLLNMAARTGNHTYMDAFEKAFPDRQVNVTLLPVPKKDPEMPKRNPKPQPLKEPDVKKPPETQIEPKPYKIPKSPIRQRQNETENETKKDKAQNRKTILPGKKDRDDEETQKRRNCNKVKSRYTYVIILYNR